MGGFIKSGNHFNEQMKYAYKIAVVNQVYEFSGLCYKIVLKIYALVIGVGAVGKGGVNIQVGWGWQHMLCSLIICQKNVIQFLIMLVEIFLLASLTVDQ